MKSASSARPSPIRTRRTGSALSTSGTLAGAFGFQPLVQFARDLDLIQMVSLVTLVLTVIFGFDYWLFQVVSRICFLIFILRPSSLRRPQFWFALALAGTITIILTWERVDNHKYLL